VLCDSLKRRCYWASNVDSELLLRDRMDESHKEVADNAIHSAKTLCWKFLLSASYNIYTNQEDWAQTSWFFDLWTFKLEANNMMLYTLLNKWKREKIETVTYLVCRPRRFPLYFIREVKHEVYGKRQMAKMKLLSSLFCCVYSRVKLFVFAMSSKWRYYIFGVLYLRIRRKELKIRSCLCR